MRIAVINGFRLLANRLHAPMYARIYTHTRGRMRDMQRGRHKRMKRRCEKANRGGEAEVRGREEKQMVKRKIVTLGHNLTEN